MDFHSVTGSPNYYGEFDFLQGLNDEEAYMSWLSDVYGDTALLTQQQETTSEITELGIQALAQITSTTSHIPEKPPQLEVNMTIARGIEVSTIPIEGTTIPRGNGQEFKLSDEDFAKARCFKNRWSSEDLKLINDTIKEKGLKKETLDKLALHFNVNYPNGDCNYVKIYIVYIINNLPKKSSHYHEWSKEESARLMNAAVKYNYNWAFIYCKCFLGSPHITPTVCLQKFQYIEKARRNDANKASKWLPIEIDKLVVSVMKHGDAWKCIANMCFRGQKDSIDCKAVYRHISRMYSEETAKWSQEEIDLLNKAVETYGTQQWAGISLKVFNNQKTDTACQSVYRHFAMKKSIERKQMKLSPQPKLGEKEAPIVIPDTLNQLVSLSHSPRQTQLLDLPQRQSPSAQKRKGLLKDFDIDFEKTEIVSIRPAPVNNNEFKLTDEHCECIERRRGTLLFLQEQCIVSTIKKEGLTEKTLQKLSKDIGKRTFVEIYLIYISLTVKAYGDQLSWSEEESALLAIAAKKYKNRFAFISCKCFKGLKSAGECRRRIESMRPAHRERLVKQFMPMINGKRKQPESETAQLVTRNEEAAIRPEKRMRFNLSDSSQTNSEAPQSSSLDLDHVQVFNEETEFDSSDTQEIISGIGQPVTPHTQPTPQFLLEINEEDSWEVQEKIVSDMVIPPTQLTPQFSEQNFEDELALLFNVPAEEDNGFTG